MANWACSKVKGGIAVENAGRRKKALAITLLLVLLLAALLLSGQSRQCLVIRHQDNGQALYAARLGEGQIFSLSFIHSVSQSPLEEYYEARAGQIYLSALHFHSFGPGLPTTATAGQSWAYSQQGGILLSNYNARQERLCYQIGSHSNFILKLGNQQIPLADLAVVGSALSFNLEQLNWWQYRRI